VASRNNSDFSGFIQVRKLMRIVPHPVIYGFVNGLAIIILSQLNQFKDASGNWLTGQSLYILVGLVLLTMLIIWGYKLTTIPASLIAILAVLEL
jgi:SulP family sulfate permease